MTNSPSSSAPLQARTDETGAIASLQLYDRELLAPSHPCQSELWVNGLPLSLRAHVDPQHPGDAHLKGERFTDHFSGWSLILARRMGARLNAKHPCFGVQSLVRRELCDQTLPTPGPGGPPVEAPLLIDTLGILGWNWTFWGDDTRMLFASSHSNGPDDEWGHVGYENDAPAQVKKYLQNVWRRIYPGTMVPHGGVFYNARDEHWLALTCRQAHVGYILNIENAGEGVGYDFTLHAPFALGQSLRLPEVVLFYGDSQASMMSWLGDYVTHYLGEAPPWVHRTTWGFGLNWNNQPSWKEQGDFWEQKIASGECSGIGYSLVTQRPVQSGTTPLSYAPDPLHGTQDEFKTMCRRLSDGGVPLLIWMSHSGLMPQGSPDIDDDWFIRGVDGRVCAAWGNIDYPELAHINPGHPGYIEYTKQWVRFYIRECGAKGIFFDCLGWAFPPDYTPRSWMRFPGDTNLQSLRFMCAIYDEIKACDPEAILLGEGTTIEAPCDVFSLAANPKREGHTMGPRDFFLSLNQHAPKTLVIDQGPHGFPASGLTTIAPGEEFLEHNRRLTQLLRQRGGPRAFVPLPDDLSLLPGAGGEADLLIVSGDDGAARRDVLLPLAWNHVRALQSDSDFFLRDEQADAPRFRAVPMGIYRLTKRTERE